MIKILVIGQIPPPYHGSNVMTEVMLNALQKLEDYRIIFLDKSFSKNIETVGKFSLRKLLRLPILIFEVLIVFLFIHPAVCLYFISCNKLAFLADVFLIFVLRLCRIPYILNFDRKGFHKLQNESTIWKLLVSSTLHNALGGIVKSKILKRDVNLFIQDERLFPMPNAIPNHPLTNQRRRKDYVQVLFLSNLIPSKGPLEVLKAAKIVIQERQDIRFILAGADRSQSFSQQLRSYISDNELDQYIKMLGGIYGEKKEKLMVSSDIFVFPTYYETFGIVNIEAMRAGLPVISSSEGAIPEIVQDGITGFIVDPKSPKEIADKILILVNNPDLRREMGMKGREVFESKYTFETYTKTLDSAIKFFLEKLLILGD